jgi:hypothetical protein
MTDRELLELAAKAASIEITWDTDGDSQWCFIPEFKPPHNRRESDKYAGRVWNPLADDGDALWLAVKLGMVVQTDRVNGFTTVTAGYSLDDLVGVSEPYADDPYAATRRAIVRAAAEIGKGA